jgi:hypothetical protein
VGTPPSEEVSGLRHAAGQERAWLGRHHRGYHPNGGSSNPSGGADTGEMKPPRTPQTTCPYCTLNSLRTPVKPCQCGYLKEKQPAGSSWLRSG